MCTTSFEATFDTLLEWNWLRIENKTHGYLEVFMIYRQYIYPEYLTVGMATQLHVKELNLFALSIMSHEEWILGSDGKSSFKLCQNQDGYLFRG